MLARRHQFLSWDVHPDGFGVGQVIDESHLRRGGILHVVYEAVL
jgi:hypothetical protein